MRRAVTATVLIAVGVLGVGMGFGPVSPPGPRPLLVVLGGLMLVFGGWLLRRSDWLRP